MILTAEQRAVLDYPLAAGETLKCNAFAGSGKTSTMVAKAEANPGTSMLYLAFNKSVEVEAKSKFPRHVKTKTPHALAWAAKGRDYRELASNVRFFHVTKRLKVDIYAATLICQTLDNWLNSADEDFAPIHAAPDYQKKYKKDISGVLLESAKVIWNEMVAQKSPFQMTHNGYLKLYQLSKPRLPYSVIMLDEGQDTNPVTFDIINRQKAYGTRVIVVGDTYQQIYTFRGAVDAMASQNCASLYLTQSFRFGENIARVANSVLTSFFNEQHSVIGNGREDALVTGFPDGEQFTVICRTNVELFNQAVQATRLGQHVHVIGEVAFNIFLDGILDVYHVFSRQMALVRDRSFQFFKDFTELKNFANDRLDNELLAKIRIVEQHQGTIPGNIEKIRQMNGVAQFADVVLVTAHKSKGLEWDNVALAEDYTRLFDDNGNLVKIRQHVLADTTLTDKQRRLALDGAVERDEINLLYVAATRAKKKLKINSDLSMLLAGRSGYGLSARVADSDPAIEGDNANEGDDESAPPTPLFRIRDLFGDAENTNVDND